MPNQDSTPEVPYAGVSYSEATGWTAWVLLGGLLLVLLGTVHVCSGVVALFRPEVLGAGRADILLPVGLTTLAWLHLLVGAAAVVAGVGLIRGLVWARVTAILLGCVAVFVNFAFVGVYPMWSVTALILSVIVIYAVAAHGAEVADAYGGS